MTVTVRLVDNPSLQITEEVVDARPPDRIAFATEGVITATEELLGEFEGRSLRPVRVELSVDGSRTVGIDLGEGTSLHLEAVDVGVETPDANDPPTGAGEM